MKTKNIRTTVPKNNLAPLRVLNIEGKQSNLATQITQTSTLPLMDFSDKAKRELRDMRAGYSKNVECMREIRRCRNLFTFHIVGIPEDNQWKIYRDEFYNNRTEEQRNKVADKTFNTLKNLMDTFPMENIYELEDAISSGLENSIMASALGYANEPYVDKGFRQEVYSRGFVEIWSFAMDMMLLTMPQDKLPPNDAEDYAAFAPYFGRMYLFALMRLNTCILHELTYNEFLKNAKNKKQESRSDLRAEIKKIKATHVAEIEELNRKIEGLTTELAKANAMATELRKSHKAAEHEIKRLEKELYKQKCNVKNSNAIEEKIETETDAEPTESIEAELIIPESNRVWFVGGHPNLVNKMRAKHPEWRFVGLDNLKLINAYKAGTTQCTCVILFTAYVSHNINDVFMDNRPENCVVLHCNGPVNESRMMEELKDDWIMQGMPTIAG